MLVRPHVGVLGHKTGLYADLTVEENMLFWAQVFNASQEDITNAVDLLGLKGRLESVSVRNLSEGQRRRVSLATLVMQRPSVWLLDEPHAALDVEGKQTVDALITGGWIHEVTTFSPAPAIYGGTDQLQRNIIGERILGLPKEPGYSKETPFVELPKN